MADLMSGGSAKTLPAIKVDSLVYSFVKDKNPGLLMQMYSKERCRELEKTDHFYDQTSLLSLLRAYRETHPKIVDRNNNVENKSREKESHGTPVDRNARQEDEAAAKGIKQGSNDVHRQVRPVAVKGNLYSQDMMHRRFCRISDPQTSVDLTIYNYFHLIGDDKALDMLFDEETREKFSKMVTKIDVPTVLRMVAHRRKQESNKLNEGFPPMSVCQLCKQSCKGARSLLMRHIGVHEEIPQYCFVEGCDKYLRSYGTIVVHLQSKHLLFAKDLSATQYHLLHSMKNAYYKKAGRFLDKYFPPESFAGYSDRKTQRRCDLEDEKCLECGEIAKFPISRQRHVVHHLNLHYECVIEGCQARTNPTDFAKHLNYHHSKKVSQLNAQELNQNRQNKSHYHKIMKDELPNYFPRKSGAAEE